MSPSSHTILKVLFLAVFTDHPPPNISDFLLTLNEVLNKLLSENKRAIKVKDININLLDVNSSAYTAYTDCFSGYGLECLIPSPTRCSNERSHSLIDHVLTNINLPIAAGIINTDLTALSYFCSFRCKFF